MYAVAKEHRSTKLLTKVRRAPILDKFDGPINNKQDSIELNEICSAINKSVVTAKTSRLFRPRYQDHQDEEISVQHQDIIRYINDSWRRIQQELEYSYSLNNTNKIILTSGDNQIISNTNKSNQNFNKNDENPTIVKIKHINGCTSSPSIPKNFVPFDLESFFGQRFIQKLLQSS